MDSAARSGRGRHEAVVRLPVVERKTDIDPQIDRYNDGSPDGRYSGGGAEGGHQHFSQDV